ncbi:MAG: phosphonate C-P lyase system protein PhnH [Pseudomonadota bacterium]
MDAVALQGGFANPPVQAAEGFRAALQAMSRPGQIEAVAGSTPPPPLSVAAGVLALVLCDHDTPIWLAPSVDGSDIREWFAFHTGAPVALRAAAQFAFGRWDEMLPLTNFAIGTPEYPDRSATLIVEVEGFGDAHRLTGPGIETDAHLTVPDPDAFRRNAALYPLGLDFFLTAGNRLAGVPRTTRVEG